MKPTLASLFPNVSESTIAANPKFWSGVNRRVAENAVAGRTGAGNGKRGVMNKTESEFSRILEGQRRQGKILRYVFEGITLRWADMRYTPDFVVFTNVMQMLRQMEMIKAGDFATVEWQGVKLIEVKGGHIWDRDIVRFKGARAYWPEFDFEMHQKTKQGWKRKF